MSRKLITKAAIYKAADSIALDGKIPTQAEVRAKLDNYGSETTIFTHLKNWKKERLLQNINKVTVENNQGYHLIEEKRILEQTLEKQLLQNENYAQELINAEKTNIELTGENHQLKLCNQKLQLELTEAKATNKALERITQKIQNELDLNTSATVKKMQQTIDDLRLELKTLNETYINALRETSTQGHEALMQEKVNSINLQAKIDNLTKELLDSKKKAYEASMTAQVQNRSLSRQNEHLQKIIQDNGLDKFLLTEEGSSIVFTNGAAVDGK